MRYLACAITACLVGVGLPTSAAMGQSSFFGWWPYGDKEKSNFISTPSLYEQTPATTPTSGGNDSADGGPASHAQTGGTAGGAIDRYADTTPIPQGPASQAPMASEMGGESSPFFRSPFADWSFPAVHLPELSLPKPRLPFFPGKSEFDETRNTWMEKKAAAESPSPWQAVTDGAHRVGASTKAAWRKTVDVFTPGDASQPAGRVAARDTTPSIWSRMFPGGKEPPPEGPRTVSEWMGQQRLKP